MHITQNGREGPKLRFFFCRNQCGPHIVIYMVNKLFCIFLGPLHTFEEALLELKVALGIQAPDLFFYYLIRSCLWPSKNPDNNCHIFLLKTNFKSV